MMQLHCPWLELSIIIPLLGAVAVALIRDPHRARFFCTLVGAVTLTTAVGAWLDLYFTHASEAIDRWDLSTLLLGRRLFTIDEVSAPLIPAVALIYLLTMMATPNTKLRRFSFAWSLVFESVRLATFSCSEPWPLIVLLAVGTWPPYRELVARKRPSRVYVLHMSLFVSLLVAGQFLSDQEVVWHAHTMWPTWLLLVAVLIRSGMFPFHCWITELFEHSSFGTALLFVAPLTGAYAAVRLVLPVAPDTVLRAIGMVSLLTAVYAAGMSLVQRDARRLFCYLFLSHSALVLVGLEMVTPIGLTGGLCVWLSVTISLTGLGLTLRAMEARFGRILLSHHLGYYPHTPMIAVCFLVTGLASVGFPGTIGFVGMELLIDGAVGVYPFVGIAVVVASMLNGIAIVRAYFLLFGGPPHESTIKLGIGIRERVAVLVLVALILGGGFFPGPGIVSRNHAAKEILAGRPPRLPLNTGIAHQPPAPGRVSLEPSSRVSMLPARSTAGVTEGPARSAGTIRRGS